MSRAIFCFQVFGLAGADGTCYLGRKLRLMLLLKDEELERLLSPSELVDAVEAAMIANEAGTHKVPQRAHIGFGDNTILLMPAIGPEGYGTKVVSVDRKSTRLNSSHIPLSRMPSSA